MQINGNMESEKTMIRSIRILACSHTREVNVIHCLDNLAKASFHISSMDSKQYVVYNIVQTRVNAWEEKSLIKINDNFLLFL